MRRIWIGRSALVAAVVLTAPGPVPASAGAPAPSPGRIAPAGAAPAPDAPAAVPVADRTRVLGAGWNRSADRAWTVSGDGDGLHVLVADAATGYAWRSAATLSEPGFDTDRWIGNACATSSGRRLVVTYAPRTFTNKAELVDRGGFTAVVGLVSGAVRKLPVSGSLAYFSPGCGAGETALVSQFQAAGRTRLVPVDAAAAKLRASVEVRGELTSAVPTRNGIVAADRGGLVRVANNGRRTAIAGTSGVPFEPSVDSAGWCGVPGTPGRHGLRPAGAGRALLPYHSVPSGQRPVNAWKQNGRYGMFGEVSQLDKGFLDEHTTLVTLSIGGNDARFIPLLERCADPVSDCPNDMLNGDAEPLRLSQPRILTDQVRPSVVTVLREIRRKAPHAKVVLMGYPLLFTDQVVLCELFSRRSNGPGCTRSAGC
jgi:hypothetical protein